VLVIPTNRPVRRADHNDVIYRTRREKYKAVIDEISECRKRGQPVLVGTVSVDTSELLSRMLKREGIPHNVLNAKNHESEADIVTHAGQPGAVTIATNMAGRGTDIKLGENVVYLTKDVILSDRTLDESYEGKTLRKLLTERPCGLHVIGSERHEARRIDRQLRGRCARQGDPGSSRFYVSLEDDLMRLFGSDRISGIMSRMGMEEGQELEHPWLNRSIETAQRRVEQHYYGIRKRTLEYDDVMNKQREVIYSFRGEIVKAENVREHIYDIVADVIESQAEDLLGSNAADSVEAFAEWVNATFPIGLRSDELKGDSLDADKAAAAVFDKVKRAYELKIEVEDKDALPGLERYVLLQSIDSLWQEYLRNIDQLREGVGLRAYGHQDPLVEYKREAYDMFSTLMDAIKLEVVQKIFRSTTSLMAYERLVASMPQKLIHREVSAMADASRGAGPGTGQGADEAPRPGVRREGEKVGRNAPCPCGSGKKYKKCCGA
ncbi:SEC-C metal-binding domain-containing protein, partial [Verrucomicrobiota bacterium]